MARSTNTNSISQSSQQQNPLLILSNIHNLISVKLDSTNFILWKYQITSVLKAYSLIGFIDGSHSCPPRFLIEGDHAAGEENPAYLAWICKDQALLSLINATLSPTALALVVGQNSAMNAWNVLLDRFASLTRTNIYNLKNELQEIKKGSDSIENFLYKIKELVDKLQAVSVSMDDEELLHIVLRGLPIEYQSFVSAMRAKNKRISFDNLRVKLLAEERALKDANLIPKDTLQNMAMIANNSAPSSSLYRSRIPSSQFSRSRNQRFNTGSRFINTSNRSNSGTIGSSGLCLLFRITGLVICLQE